MFFFVCSRSVSKTFSISCKCVMILLVFQASRREYANESFINYCHDRYVVVATWTYFHEIGTLVLQITIAVSILSSFQRLRTSLMYCSHHSLYYYLQHIQECSQSLSFSEFVFSCNKQLPWVSGFVLKQ